MKINFKRNFIIRAINPRILLSQTNQRLLLWKDCIILNCIVCFFMALIYIAADWMLHKRINYQAQERILQESNRIEKELVDLFQKTHELMTYIGKGIVNSQPEDLLLIWKQVKGTFARANKDKDSFMWPDLGWVDAQMQQILNTRSGVLSIPLDMSIRDYVRTAPMFPWTLQFAKPGPSIPEHLYGSLVIPFGMGIFDDRKTFLGIVSAAFNIPDLVKQIDQVIKDHTINFVILDRQGNIILQTLGHKLEEKENELNNLRKLLKKKTASQSIAFSFVKQIKGTPFTLVTYLNHLTIQNEHYQKLVPILLKIVGGGLCCLVLVYFFLKSVMKQNRELIKTKKHLEEAVALAKASDFAKEEFLKRMQQELLQPFVNIVTYTDILLKSLKGEINLELSSDKEIQFLERIKEAAVDLQTLTTNVLDLSYVDVKSVLEECMTILAKQAYMKGVFLDKDLPSLPPLYADELRFKQIIVGLLSRAIQFSRKGDRVWLAANVHIEDNKLFLKIILKDQGIGLSEEEWQRLRTKYNGETGISRCTDGTDLELPAIERLIYAHQGKCTFEYTWKKGTTAILLFPYSLKDESQKKEQGNSLEKSPLILCNWRSSKC